MPALPLGLAWANARFLLIEANGRRARFMTQAVRRLTLQGRVAVRRERAEAVGRDPTQRGRHDAVVARGFGPAGVTAECGAPFLRVGGRLLIAEPPDERLWPAEPLAQLGLVARGRQGSVMVLEQDRLCPDRFPRRAPRNRPLF